MQSVERNDIFDLAFRFITETAESIFLTGKAGTGKTTFLKYLQHNSSKNIIVAAPTGVAAINAGGVTLHSLFQLPFHPYLPTDANRMELLKNIRYNKQRVSLLRKMELLVIDEISMVRCDTIDAIDAILRSVRRNHSVPFGGVQVLFIGDLYQLPPVAKTDEWNILKEYYQSSFFFDSKAVKEQMPLLIELNKIYRQKEESFVELLNKVRNNQLSAEDYEQLNKRFIRGFQPTTEEKFITLTSHNNQADGINQVKLQQLTTPAHTFTATIEGDFPEHVYPADADLVLKEGAQVMFIKNDVVSKKYFNGKIGIIQTLEKNKIIVRSDGEDIEVLEEIWENTRYTVNRADEKLEQEVLGRFKQYPLRLAWAITIHKSQGLTFEKVMIDAASSFSSGQVYVALSRCTSLEGIVLLSAIPSSAIYSNSHVMNAQSSLVPKGSLAERFAGARQLFTIQLLSELFLLDEIDTAAHQLQTKLEKQAEKLNAGANEWMQQFILQLTNAKSVADKFMIRVHELMRSQHVIEENEALQKRIQDAGNYFSPLVISLKDQLQKHPMITEHKETATAIDESLSELMHAFVKTTWYLQYCKQPFTVAGYLKHKLNLSIPRVQITSYAANKKQAAASGIPNPELYYLLKNWRDRICEEQNMPIYLLANSNSLTEICNYLPLTKQHLMLLSGFGKAKAEKYGDEIIDIVELYCNQNGLETNMEAKSANPKRQRKEPSEKKADKTPSGKISLQYFQQGKSIVEIAKERNLAAGTIEGHLTEFIKTGELGVDVFANETTVQMITELVVANPGKTYGEIKAMAGDGYTFTQIRAVMNHLLWREQQNA
jgi:DNA-binding CsgD family transcriptional regulator/GTPase SAR1 family protein